MNVDIHTQDLEYLLRGHSLGLEIVLASHEVQALMQGHEVNTVTPEGVSISISPPEGWQKF